MYLRSYGGSMAFLREHAPPRCPPSACASLAPPPGAPSWTWLSGLSRLTMAALPPEREPTRAGEADRLRFRLPGASCQEKVRS